MVAFEIEIALNESNLKLNEPGSPLLYALDGCLLGVDLLYD